MESVTTVKRLRSLTGVDWSKVKQFTNGERLHGPMFVGIDASLTGHAIALVDRAMHHHIFVYKPPHKGVVRLEEIRQYVYRALFPFHERVVEVAMEGYSFGSQTRAHSMGECGAATKMALFELFRGRREGFPTLVPPPSLKKFVTGKGNSKKQEMLLGVYKKWGVELNNDNAADALALARVAAAVHLGSELKYEQEVVERLTRNTEWET